MELSVTQKGDSLLVRLEQEFSRKGQLASEKDKQAILLGELTYNPGITRAEILDGAGFLGRELRPGQKVLEQLIKQKYIDETG